MNRVILIGRLGADPDSRTSQGGTHITNFKLATSERKKEGDKWVEATEWHRVTCFGKTAEVVGEYLSKGREVGLEGRVQTRKWQDKDGNDRYTTEVIADRIHFIGSKTDRAPDKDAPEPPAKSQQGVEPFEDDIPFAPRHYIS